MPRDTCAIPCACVTARSRNLRTELCFQFIRAGLDQVLFPASVTVLQHIPGHANQKQKKKNVSVYLFACSSREIPRSLYYQALCHHGSSDEHSSSTQWHCYLCPAPAACKTQALGLARAPTTPCGGCDRSAHMFASPAAS
jgi:hypothetical protein